MALEIIDRVEFEVLEDKKPVYVEAVIEAENEVRAIISGNHDDLKEITVDGQTVYKNDNSDQSNQSEEELDKIIKKMNIQQLIELVEKEFDSRHLHSAVYFMQQPQEC